MESTVYRLQGVRVERSGRVVLDLPALDIAGGRVTAIVGPNGAGKTTLLRVLAFLLQPHAGGVEFQGQRVTPAGVAACRQQVTLVAQSPLLFRRSVRANLAYGVRARGLTIGGQVETALAAVGLSDFAERPAWKLSGGEAQRVAVARALALDLPVYLFDEPTANVDRQHVATIESLITNLGTAGKTVVLTTHNLEQAYRVSDTVVSLAEGDIAPFPLINVLRGTTTRAGGVTYFVSDSLRIEIPDGTTVRGIAIDPDNIIVSTAPLHSSARNCFPGHVVRVAHDARGVVVTIDCGRPLIAHITQHSYQELSLNVGTAVYVTFKSSAIHALDAESSPR